MKWLLVVLAEPGSKVTEEEFNKWYDEEHIPVRLKTKGWASAARYKSIDAVTPKASWAAFYELDDGGVLGSPGSQAIVRDASDNEKDIISRAESLQWQLYKPIIDSAVDLPDLPKPAINYARYLANSTANVSPEHEKEFNDWYREEGIPAFSKAPGWVRTCRYSLAGVGDLAGSLGQPLNYLAVIESTDLDFFNASEFTATVEKAKPWLTSFEERKFELYKDFGYGTA